MQKRWLSIFPIDVEEVNRNKETESEVTVRRHLVWFDANDILSRNLKIITANNNKSTWSMSVHHWLTVTSRELSRSADSKPTRMLREYQIIDRRNSKNHRTVATVTFYRYDPCSSNCKQSYHMAYSVRSS